jgi:hypothetical protein
MEATVHQPNIRRKYISCMDLLLNPLCRIKVRWTLSETVFRFVQTVCHFEM